MEMLHSLLSHTDPHRTELPFRSAVGSTSTAFGYMPGTGDFLLWIIWGLFQCLLGH